MRTIKLVIIGDSGVGKTSLRSQYITGRFSTGYRTTIGTDFITKTLPHYRDPDEGSVTLQIWDTAGQERFSSLSSAFFRGADAALLMFDVNRPETLDGLLRWWDEFKAHAPVPDEEAEDYCCVLVGNKVDLVADRDASEVSCENGGLVTGTGDGHQRVSEAEAERFLEVLIPRTSSSSPQNAHADPDDPFVAYDGGYANGRIPELFLRSSASLRSAPAWAEAIAEDAVEPEADSEFDSPPRLRTQSISIQNGLFHVHPQRTRVHKSRSSERSQFGGTMTTTHSAQTLFHTPVSSLFGADAFESALSSPFQEDTRLHGTAGCESPSTSAARALRRMTPSSSSSSAPTITPSLFMRAQASASTSAAPTPPTPPEADDARARLSLPRPARVVAQPRFARARLPAAPERRPKMFLASAKTGAGVAPVFEYVARRVVMRWEYAEALEARTMHMRDGTVDSLQLAGARRQNGRQSGAGWRTPGAGRCCGS